VTSDAVPEDSTGGGTAMICRRFKAIGRLVSGSKSGNTTTYTVAALAQANYGSQDTLRIGGVPIGRRLAQEAESEDKVDQKNDGSIVIIIATDVPLYSL
jgi:D-aminopeptidase